jgi:S-DNA-T family DNA segregation ATPase FtsK/SpoIIIE
MTDFEPAWTPDDAPSLATVIVEAGPSAGLSQRLPAGTWTVGRGGEADVVLADPEASRLHAQLVVDLYGVTVEDLGSKNGVLVDGAAVIGPREAKDGAVIELGATKLRVHHEGSRLARALAAGGEVTRTTRRARAAARAQALGEVTPTAPPRPMWPLVLLALGLAALAVALQLW